MSPTFTDHGLLYIYETGLELTDGAVMSIRWDGLAIMVKDPAAGNRWQFHAQTTADTPAEVLNEIHASAEEYDRRQVELT